MEITTQQAYDAFLPLQKLKKAEGLRAPVVYDIVLKIQSMVPSVQAFDQARSPVFARLGAVTEGNLVQIPADKVEEFLAEMRPVFESKVGVHGGRIPLSELKTVTCLTGDDMEQLTPLIDAEG